AKGTRARCPNAGAFEMGMMADGVEPDDLYPIDFDRAFHKLDEIISDIQWWDTGAQSQQLLGSGEVGMGHVWNGRMYSLIKEDDANIDIDWYNNIKAGAVIVYPSLT